MEKTTYPTLDMSNLIKNRALLPLKVTAQVLDKRKNIVQILNQEYSFLKAATSWGKTVEGTKATDHGMRILMDEAEDPKNFKQIQKQYSYKIVVEYDTKRVPWEDTEKVNFPFNIG